MQADVRKAAKSEKIPRRKKHSEQLSGAMDFFASPKRSKPDDLEVTGISRSGRVRKKSSKLVDFESPDDLAESKYKRQKMQQQLMERYGTQQPLSNQGHSSQHESPNRQRKNSGSNSNQQRAKQEPVSDNEVQSSGSESDEAIGTNDEERYSMDSGSDDEVDPLMIDDRETGFRRLEPPGQETPSQANSLYMLEKCKKKLIIKDGKIIGRMKAQRKDKGGVCYIDADIERSERGDHSKPIRPPLPQRNLSPIFKIVNISKSKTRFTAYMLWAKEIRHELLTQCPYMDFAQISKRLGELWATVPNLEKYNWRRRAKRLASKPGIAPASKDESVWKMPPPASRKKFINKIGNGKETKTSSSKKTIQLGMPSVVGNVPISPPSSRVGKELVNEPVIGTGMYKVVGTQPVDVAAHLKLLGESLTIIGERLKEHEGQIAVSGSLSVLLDSLLCALGPLVCLTQQVPGADGAKPEVLSEMLDNIAYIMPGL